MKRSPATVGGRGSVRAAVAMLTGTCLVLAACGGDDVSSSDADLTTTQVAVTDSVADEPAGTVPAGGDTCTTDRVGGTLTVAIPTLGGLDPLTEAGASNGGWLVPVYDTLMRFDPVSGEFEPQLAESLTPDDSGTVWTLVLREGIEFGNGDPLDAAAVKASIDRHRDPANNSVSLNVAQLISSVDIVDPRTVTFTLADPWGTFPIALTSGIGHIVNLDAVEAVGAEEFARTAVDGGAGPYEVARWAPPETIEFRAKQDWWGGPVCIEELRYIAIADGEAAVDAFELGEVDVELVDARAPQASARAKQLTDRQQTIVQHGGGILLMNSTPGGASPTADVRVRQAIAAAIDVETINERAFAGTAVAQDGLIAEGSEVFAATSGPGYDLERAQTLVEEVKSETGWDGALRFDCVAPLTEVAIAVEAMLEAAGFDVDMNSGRTLGEQVQLVVIDRNYELACLGHTPDEASFWRGLLSYDSRNPGSFSGVTDPAMDEALDTLRAAVTTSEVQDAMEDVQVVWNEIVPAAVYAAFEHVMVWQDHVHGLYFNGSPTVTPYWDRAFVDEAAES